MSFQCVGHAYGWSKAICVWETFAQSQPTMLWILFGLLRILNRSCLQCTLQRRFAGTQAPLMQTVLRRNVRGVWLIWHTELNSAFFSALIENTLLVSITLESLLCVGDQVVQGCSILSSAPLSINLPCLSYHFDQGGVLFLQPGLKFFSNFKGLKTSHFGFPPPSLITAVFLQLPLFRN